MGMYPMNRRWRMFIMSFIIILNFILVLFVISSTISIIEQNKSRSDAKIIQSFKIKQIEDFRIKDHYFRIDYIINQGVCKPIEIFNTTTTIASIQHLTKSKLNQLLTQNINIDIISINPILIKSHQIQQNSTYKSRQRSVCDYLIELYIAFDFPSYCDAICQSQEIQRLTSNSQPFGDPVDDSFIFITHSLNSIRSTIKFHIRQFYLYRSSKYNNKSVYIRSFYEDRYISGLIIDSNSQKTSVTMTKVDRSLFLIKDGLDLNNYENDSSSIYVSFSLLLIPNVYLRHEDGRIKLAKNNQLNLFKQDATFKLIINKDRQDMVALESINLPRSYVAVDSDSRTALILKEPENVHRSIEHLDGRFLFKFIFNE